MITSTFILDIFELAFDGLPAHNSLNNQVRFLSESHREHTGIGLFVYFNLNEGIEVFRVPADDPTNVELINGVEITNKKLNILADVTVHLSEGFIQSVEIWNKNGHDFPTNDLTTYELTQIWREPMKRKTIQR